MKNGSGGRNLYDVELVASTTWQALFKVAGLKAGQNLLIHGAAGGLGIFAVQFAKAKGARVIGTASGSNQSFLRELGVDEPIDYAKTKFEDVARDVDVVLDTQGGDTQQRSWKVLKKSGVLVSVVQPPSDAEAAKHGVKAAMFRRQANTGELSEIAMLIDSARVKVVVELSCRYRKQDVPKNSAKRVTYGARSY